MINFKFHFVATALIAGVALSISSCSKNFVEPSNNQLAEVCDEQSAMKDFSVALSQALFAYPEVREFLKAEALKRFDNDDEVLYYLVKDEEIGSLGTFREIMISEMGDAGRMERIEKEFPTLTILVSDASVFDPEGFCLDRWDTSNPYVAVTYRERDGLCRELFGDGQLLGIIKAGTLPGGPVLIVKENERVVASASTKGEDIEFSFISDAFDPSKNQLDTKAETYYHNEPEGDHSDYIAAATLNAINPDIIKAYDLFKNNSYACQNDYIFYGMTSNSTKGRLRTDVRNKIYRIKLAPRAFSHVFDEPADCNFTNIYKTTDNGKGYNATPTQKDVYTKLWADGRLELRFTVLAGNLDASVYTVSVTSRDLFTVRDNVVKRTTYPAHIFKWYIDWVYEFTQPRGEKAFIEKWFNLPSPMIIPSWDLIQLSSYRIRVEEVDAGVTTTTEETVSTKHATSTNGKISLDKTVKVELGWNDSDEESRSSKQTISWQDTNDLLLEIPISYADKIIRTKVDSKYEVYSYGSGDFTFTVLPYRY